MNVRFCCVLVFFALWLPPSSHFAAKYVFRLPQVRDMLNAFRENSTLEHAIEKVDAVCDLVGTMLDMRATGAIKIPGESVVSVDIVTAMYSWAFDDPMPISNSGLSMNRNLVDIAGLHFL